MQLRGWVVELRLVLILFFFEQNTRFQEYGANEILSSRIHAMNIDLPGQTQQYAFRAADSSAMLQEEPKVETRQPSRRSQAEGEF